MDITRCGVTRSLTAGGIMLASAVDDMTSIFSTTVKQTHYHAPTNSISVLDLSMCTPDALLNIIWRVTKDMCRNNQYLIALASEAVSSSHVPR